MPPISSTTQAQSAPPTSPATTPPTLTPATVPSGAPGTGVGGAATSSDNGVLLTASGMALFAGLAGLVLIARRRRHA
jgi:LPXTG-motif cell wall-anchored protein